MNNFLRPHKLTFAALIVCVLFLYSPSVEFDFLSFDDAGYILANPMVAGGFSWDAVLWAFSSVQFKQWMPVTMLSFMLDAELFGLESASGWHLMNVLIHVVNCVLLTTALRGLSMPAWQRLITTALFALHPMHVEVVAWVVERKELLAMTFGLMSWIAFQRWRQYGKFTTYLLCCLAFLASLASKPMWVTWPLVLWIIDWSIYEFRWRSMAGSLFDKLPLFVMSVAISLVTLYKTAPWTLLAGDRPSIANADLNVPAAYGYYLKKSFWPFDLSTFMELWPGSPVLQDALVGVLLLVVGSSIAVYASRHHRLVLVGWLWFVITLIPVSGLFQAGHQWVADRYSYLPHIGLFVSVTMLFSEFVRARPKFFVTGNTVVVISLAGLAWGASAQLPHWRDTEHYYERTIDVTGGGPVTHLYFGNYLSLIKRPRDALTHYEEANRLAYVHGYLVPSALQSSAYTALLLDDTALAKERTAMLLELGFDKNTLGRSTALGLVLRASGEHALAKEVFSQLLKHYEKRELDWSTRARLGLIASNIDLGQAKKADQQLGVYMSTMPRFQSEVCAMFEGGNRAAAGKQDLALFLFVLNSEPLRGTLIDYCG